MFCENENGNWRCLLGPMDINVKHAMIRAAKKSSSRAVPCVNFEGMDGVPEEVFCDANGMIFVREPEPFMEKMRRGTSFCRPNKTFDEPASGTERVKRLTQMQASETAGGPLEKMSTFTSNVGKAL